MATQAQLDHKVRKAHKDLLDHKDHKDLLDHRDHKDPLVTLAQLGHKAHKAL